MEHAEHTTHASGGHGGGGNKLIGVTMAIIGALIAFCAAKVGGERNELTRTMMKQTQAYTNYTAATTKYRAVLLELEKQRGKIAVSTAGGAAASAMDLQVVRRFIEIFSHYAAERKISKAWADAYQPLVDEHFEAAEKYERAQMLAEFGIVFASLAVLLGSRPVWAVSVCLAIACVAQVATTHFHAHHEVEVDERKVEAINEQYQKLRDKLAAAHDDEKLLDELDPGAVIRNAAQPPTPEEKEPAEHGKPEHH
jgi:hypothetical protein